jgi:hypothetical protein
LISLPLYLTFAISQWQWQHSLDVQNSSTSTTSHHFCNLFFTSWTGPLQCPHIMLSQGLPHFTNPTITCLSSICNFLLLSPEDFYLKSFACKCRSWNTIS